jgi:hypothetical protein
MISRDVLVDVLTRHAPRYGVRDRRIHCRCGWSTDQAPDAPPRLHLTHQVDVILNAIADNAGGG